MEYAWQRLEEKRKEISELWDKINKLSYDLGVKTGELSTAKLLLKHAEKRNKRLETHLAEMRAEADGE